MKKIVFFTIQLMAKQLNWQAYTQRNPGRGKNERYSEPYQLYAVSN